MVLCLCEAKIHDKTLCKYVITKHLFADNYGFHNNHNNSKLVHAESRQQIVLCRLRPQQPLRQRRPRHRRRRSSVIVVRRSTEARDYFCAHPHRLHIPTLARYPSTYTLRDNEQSLVDGLQQRANLARASGGHRWSGNHSNGEQSAPRACATLNSALHSLQRTAPQPQFVRILCTSQPNEQILCAANTVLPFFFAHNHSKISWDKWAFN